MLDNLNLEKTDFCFVCKYLYKTKCELSQANFDTAKKCTRCERVLTTKFNEDKCEEKLESSKYFSLPPWSFYFHVKQSALDFDTPNKFDYSDKIILLVGMRHIYRKNYIVDLKQGKFKKFVCLSEKKLDWLSDFVDDWIVADDADDRKADETLNAVQNYMQENNLKFDAVITYFNENVRMTAFLANKLNLHGSSYDMVSRLSDKYDFRNISKSLDINYPKYCLIKSNERRNLIEKFNEYLNNGKKVGDEKFLHDLFKFGLPIIIKNRFGTAKDFVRKCTTVDDILNVLNESLNLKLYNENFRLTDEFDLVIEEFYEGHEIDMDILVQNDEIKIILIADNYPVEPPFIEEGARYPSTDLNEEEKDFIIKQVKEWVSKLKLKTTIVHFEAKCLPISLYKHKGYIKDEQQNWKINGSNFLMPIEMNLRMGGGGVWCSLKSTYSFDLACEYVNAVLGFEIDEKYFEEMIRKSKYQVLCKSLIAKKIGQVKAIELPIEEMINDPDLVEFSLSFPVESTLNGKPYAYVIYRGLKGQLKQIEDKLNKHIKKYRILVE